MINMEKARDDKAYGLWKVTTEGDCEGKSVRDLGVYEGYLDEIAFALASKAYYALHFERIDSRIPVPTEARESVDVILGAESRTWDLNSSERVAYFRRLLTDRDVEVCESMNYAAVTLRRSNTEQCEREIALSKLTEREKEILGITL